MADRPREQILSEQGNSRPLTDREKQQITRFLSEPMEFPMEYRTWLKNYVETAGVQLPRSSIVGLSAGIKSSAWEVVRESQPPGTVLLGIWRQPPPGTVAADGSVFSREEYPRLADALGVHPDDREFELPRIYAPDGQRYVIVTGERPLTMRESEG